MEILLISGKVVLVVLSLVFAYILLGFILPIIPLNRRFRSKAGGIKIYIISNGVHADFLLPAVHSVFDWGDVVNFSDYKNAQTIPTYVGIGWGDRGFYLDTPTWAELKVSTALNAMLVPSPTVMHVLTYDEIPTETHFAHEIEVSLEQYSHLCAYIFNQFRKDEYNRVELLPGVGYTPQDNFYEANGSYHAFNTCNCWISRGLNKIGVRTALWTPTDRGIFYHLKKTV